MKLLLEDNRIVGIAGVEYPGPMPCIDAPEDFESELMSEYRYVDGQLVLDREGLVRRQRDELLRDTVDVINPMRWEDMTAEEQDAWRQYRQDLLDIPQQEGFPEAVTWPTQPGA